MPSPVRHAFRLLGFVAIAAACSAQSEELKPVRIALGSQVINVTYPWLTLPKSLGYWQAEGYNVQVQGFSGALQALQQMASGSAELAQLNASVLIQGATDNGLDVKGVMANGVVDWGIGVPDSSPIKSIKELKGKTIGVVSLATGGIPLLKTVLKDNGISPDTDVKILAVGAGAPALDALQNSRVDALMYWGSALVGFQNAGGKLRIMRDKAWMTYPDFTLSTMQSTIDADPKMIEAIVRGAAKAVVFVETNPDCAIKLQWKNYPSTKPSGVDEETALAWDRNLLAAQLENLKQAFNLNGGRLIGNLTPEPLGNYQRFMLDNTMIKKTKAPDSLILSDKGFFERVNNFDHEAIVKAAQACTI